MVIFRDPVTPLQAFGYAIALGGLVYYKLGRDGVNNLLAQVQYQLLGGPRPEN
jgi:carotenoid cleavage dioxygenase-like enzyme